MKGTTILLCSGNARIELEPTLGTLLWVLYDKRGAEAVRRPIGQGEARALAERLGGVTRRGSDILGLPVGGRVQRRIVGGTCHVSRR